MEVPQRFCVRWNSYKSNLQTAFPKLLTSEHFVDVTLACEKQFIKCHKIVLSACSVYFETLLVNNPCQHPIIFMKDVEFWEIKALVEFMYKGEVSVLQDQLDSLLKSAESLQIRGLSGTKQFFDLEKSNENNEECSSEHKIKKSKTESEDEDDGVRKKKKKNEDDEKVIQIMSVRGLENTLNDDSEDETDKIYQKVVKEETIDHDYEYESFVNLQGEEESGEFAQSVYYPDNSNDPGPSGLSEFILPNPSPPENCEEENEDLNSIQKTDTQKTDTQKPEENLRLKRASSRRSCYKQYTMASMWAALERVEQGLSVYRASIEYGVPRKTLRNWMKKYNIMSYFDLRKQEREQHNFVANLN